MNARKVLTSKFVLLVGLAAVLALSAGETFAGRPRAGGTRHVASAYSPAGRRNVTPSSRSRVWITRPSAAHRRIVITTPAPWRRSVIGARPVPYRLRGSAQGHRSFRRIYRRSRSVRHSRSFGSGGGGFTITIRIGG